VKHVIWDLDDDPDGNVAHIAEHGISVEEVEQVLYNRKSTSAINRNPSGNQLTFGLTKSGRYLAVVWEYVCEDPLTMYPVTAYDATQPRSRNR
jgi:uncharacterized DUF497 family protein